MDQRIINDIMMALPKDAADLVSDFIRASMVLGWDSTRHLLGRIIEYVSLTKANVNADARIKSLEEEIGAELDRLVFSYTNRKYADDPLYQKWVLGRK